MTDAEFDVLDELYFVTSYKDLQSNAGLTEEDLIGTLKELKAKSWIKVLSGPDDEVRDEEIDISGSYSEYFYLASKKGLLAHNGTE
jgi:hypothetical protein